MKVAALLLLSACRCANVENAAGKALGEAELEAGQALYPVKQYGPVRVDNLMWRSSRLDSLPRYRQLDELGIRGVLDLRAEGLHDASYGALEVSLAVYVLPIVDNTAMLDQGPGFPQRLLTAADLADVWRWVEAVGEIDCHCEAGQGRTGMVVAAWRCYHDGKTAEWALTEAHSFGPTVPAQEQWVRDYCATVLR